MTCPSCELAIGIHVPSQEMLPALESGVERDGLTWFPCSNRSWECNWLVDRSEGDERCLSCRITRRRPDADDTIAREKLAIVDRDKRRLLLRLNTLGLPITPW